MGLTKSPFFILNNLSPKALEKASRKIGITALGINIEEDFNSDKKILDEFRKSRSVNIKNIIPLLYVINRLNVSEREVVYKGVLNGNQNIKDKARAGSVYIISSFAPEEAGFCLLKSPLIRLLEPAKLLDAFLKAGPQTSVLETSFFESEVNFLDEIRNVMDSLGDVLRFLKHLLIEEDKNGVLWRRRVTDIVDAFRRYNIKSHIGFELLNEIAKKIVSGEDKTWTSRILNNESPSGSISSYCIENASEINFESYKYIQILLEERRRLDKNLVLLDQKVPERGAFWRQHLNRFSRIIAREFDDGRVGVAFFLGDYVICEFGPVDNAAYVYENEIFMKDVNKVGGGSWKDKNFTTTHFPDLSEGRLTHGQGWKIKATLLLEKIENDYAR